jgi:hypothetical protein
MDNTLGSVALIDLPLYLYCRPDHEEEGEEEELKSLKQEEPYQPPPHRLTPLLFTRPHVCARFYIFLRPMLVNSYL